MAQPTHPGLQITMCKVIVVHQIKALKNLGHYGPPPQFPTAAGSCRANNLVDLQAQDIPLQ
jgi:hypothetical protein